MAPRNQERHVETQLRWRSLLQLERLYRSGCLVEFWHVSNLTLLALESEVNDAVAIVLSDEKRGRTMIRHETKPMVCEVKSWKHEMENG